MKKYSLINYVVGSVILILVFIILFTKSKSGFRGGSMGGGHGSMSGGGHGSMGGGGHGSMGHGSIGHGGLYGGGWGWNDGSDVGWPYEYTSVIVNQDSGAGCLQDFECASNQCNNGTCE